jgi:DNA polymerase-3 subunit delta'
MSFDKVIGHENAILIFQKMIVNDAFPHALLIDGMMGVGKSKLVFELSKAIFCDTLKTDACNTCKSCLKMIHENHPDYLDIYPDGKQIKNHQIEAFQSFLSKKAYTGSYKIVCIHDAHKMNASAQNRILKTLEDPSEKVVIFLLTHQAQTLMETVKSRCQKIKLSGISEEAISKFLIEEHNIDPVKSSVYSKLSNGSLGRAIEYVTSTTFSEIQAQIEILLKAIDQKNKMDVLKSLDFFLAEKEKISDVLEYMVLWYRDLLLYKKAKAKKLLIHGDSFELIKQLARNLSVKQVIKNIETIASTEKKLNQNGHYDLTIELLLIQLLEA